jgi:hypothetical protein
LRIDYGAPAVEYAADIAKELTRAGFKVTLSKKAAPPATLFGGTGVGATNLIEIHQFITDYWPLISPFIPYMIKAIGKAVRSKRRNGDKTRTRVKLEARDTAIVDFNDEQIERREHKTEGPTMIIPDVSEIVSVPDETEPEAKPAPKKVPQRRRPKKDVKKAKPRRKKGGPAR